MTGQMIGIYQNRRNLGGSPTSYSIIPIRRILR